MTNKNIFKLIAAMIVIVLLVAIYFVTPLNEYLSVDKITQLTREVPQTTGSALIFLAVFFVGGALLIPVPFMAFAVSLVFNVGVSLLICLPGFLLASLSGYLVGRVIGTDGFGDTLGKHMQTIKDKVDDKGAWALLALRLAPTPPFTVTSIIAGSMQLNVCKYALGSMLGIAPLGLSAIFFGKGALEMMKQPSALAGLSIVAALILYGVYWLIKRQQTEQQA